MGNEREQRALDALIVSQLRSCSETEIGHFLALSDDERAALDSLGPDFVDKLLHGKVQPCGEIQSDSAELAAAGEAFGMNRAKEIDPKSKEELDQKRQEIIERIKRLEGGDGQSGR
jgi:hypothetical protein